MTPVMAKSRLGGTPGGPASGLKPRSALRDHSNTPL